MFMGFLAVGFPVPTFLSVTEYETVLVTAQAAAAKTKSPTAADSSAIRRTVFSLQLLVTSRGTTSPLFRPLTLNANGPALRGAVRMVRLNYYAVSTWQRTAT